VGSRRKCMARNASVFAVFEIVSLFLILDRPQRTGAARQGKTHECKTGLALTLALSPRERGEAALTGRRDGSRYVGRRIDGSSQGFLISFHQKPSVLYRCLKVSLPRTGEMQGWRLLHSRDFVDAAPRDKGCPSMLSDIPMSWALATECGAHRD
jgi:hypothetical protein